MGRLSVALAVLSASLACALDVDTVNSSGQRLSFAWSTGLLRPHLQRESRAAAPGAAQCTRACPRARSPSPPHCNGGVHPQGLCGVFARGALAGICLRQPLRARSVTFLRAGAHGHSHGDPSAQDDCGGHTHAGGAEEARKQVAGAAAGKRHNVVLVMDAAKEENLWRTTPLAHTHSHEDDAEHDHGNRHSHASATPAAALGHTHSGEEDCQDDHGTGHSHSHSDSHSHAPSHAGAEECQDDHGTGHSHSHADSHSHSHAGA